MVTAVTDVRKSYGGVFGENGSDPHINRSATECISLLGNKTTVDGRASRWLINEILYKLNEFMPMGSGPWGEVEWDTLALESEVKTLFDGEGVSSSYYRNGPYYLNELDDTIAIAEDSKRRAVTGDVLAKMFGDIDGAFKTICGETAYNEYMTKLKNAKLKTESDLYLVKGMEESNE